MGWAFLSPSSRRQGSGSPGNSLRSSENTARLRAASGSIRARAVLSSGALQITFRVQCASMTKEQWDPDRFPTLDHYQYNSSFHYIFHYPLYNPNITLIYPNITVYFPYSTFITPTITLYVFSGVISPSMSMILWPSPLVTGPGRTEPACFGYEVTHIWSWCPA